MSEPSGQEAEVVERRPRLPPFLALLLTIAIIWLGGQFVTHGLSDQLVGTRPEWAVLLQADSPDAVGALARKAMLEKNYDGAIRLSARSLQLEPLSAPNLTTFAIAMDHRGRRPASEAAMSLAGRLGWRDVLTQLWLFRSTLLQARFAEALSRADAVMRREGGAPPALYALLAAAAQDPQTSGLVADRLAVDPPWRKDFFDYVTQVANPPAVDAASSMLNRLRGSPSPPTQHEIGQYLESLVVEREFDRARRDWLSLASPRLTPGSYIYDGDFSQAPKPGPFDWVIRNGVGWTATVEAAPSGGRALRLDYDGFAQPQPLGQVLVMPPGAYRFTGRWLNPTGGAAQDLRWIVTCLGPAKLIGELRMPPAAAAGWRQFGLDITVPPTGCPAQFLELLAIPGDSLNDTTIWFESLEMSAAKEPRGAAIRP